MRVSISSQRAAAAAVWGVEWLRVKRQVSLTRRTFAVTRYSATRAGAAVGPGLLDGVDELLLRGDGERLQQCLPVREPAVDGDPRQPRRLGDLLHGSAGVLGEDPLGRLQNRAHTALGVCPQRSAHVCLLSGFSLPGVPCRGYANATGTPLIDSPMLQL